MTRDPVASGSPDLRPLQDLAIRVGGSAPRSADLRSLQDLAIRVGGSDESTTAVLARSGGNGGSGEGDIEEQQRSIAAHL